jgi:zinc transport system permease protein
MLELFQYGFIVRGLEAGVIIGLVAPVIGIFLVLRRYALIADTLAHVSLAGIALGFVFALNPLIIAIAASVASSVAVERLRLYKRVYADSALSIFLSGSLALAVVLISIGRGFGVDIFNYLFGSIVTVKPSDLYVIAAMGVLVLASVAWFYRDLLYVTFDEEAAQVAGVRTHFINILLIMLSALTVSLAVPIVGTLLIAALIVIPVVAALQLKKDFLPTMFYAQAISVFSVLAGIISSYYLNIAAGGTIVLLAVLIFVVLFLYKKSGIA